VVGRRVRRDLPGLGIVCVGAAIVSVFYIGLYLAKHYKMPIGWDTARYLDQTNLVIKHGLHGVADVHIPRPSQTLTSRVGYPVSLLALSRLLGSTTIGMAAIVPIAAIVGTALAAGAFVSYSLRRTWWEATVVALIVGTSPAMVRLIAGTYGDNLLAAAIFAAALTPLLSAARDGEGIPGAIALFAVGGLVHSAFFAFTMAVLGAVTVIYVPYSWRQWRRGRTSLLGTPAARLATVLGGSVGLAGAGVYGLLRTTPAQPELSRGEFAMKIRQDVPLYRFPLTTPVAVAGLAALGWDLRRARPRSDPPSPSAGGSGTDGPGSSVTSTSSGPSRLSDRFTVGFVLVLMLAWGALAAAGVIAFHLGRVVPAHRFLAFLLPFPVVIAVGVLGVGRLAAARGGSILRNGRWIGVGVVLAGVLAMGYIGYRDLYGTLNDRGIEFLDEGKIQDAASAQAYLDAVHVREAAPVVFVIDDEGPNPRLFLPEEAHIMRSVMRADRIEHAYFYLGTPQNYMAGVKTIRPGDTRDFNKASTRFWRVLEPVLPERPVALLLAGYNPAYRAFTSAHPELRVAFNVVALNGPQPARPVASPPFPSAPRGFGRFGVAQAAVLVALTLIGMGWALALLPRWMRPFEVLALSISFGFAFLILGGALVDAAGIRLGGLGGGLIGPAVGIVGWAVAGRRLKDPALFAS
jgi:hypothetical protein